MEQRVLGSTGLTVPVVGMGTWRTFDVRGAAAQAQTRASVDRAYAAGATFFDSLADVRRGGAGVRRGARRA